MELFSKLEDRHMTKFRIDQMDMLFVVDASGRGEDQALRQTGSLGRLDGLGDRVIQFGQDLADTLAQRERVAQAGYVGHAYSSVATQFADSRNVSRLTD